MEMRNLAMGRFLISMALLLTGSLQAQEAISWSLLEQVDVSYEQDSVHNVWMLHPDFSENLQALDQQPVTIRGYALPTSVTSGTYVLSAFPFSSCFFCGGAGPESVVELQLAHPRNFSTDEFVTLTGRLRLLTETESFLYRLENATVSD